ncbi:MAG: hypothetical protein WD294_05430 [Phycisphaeraceae bacterium]
MSSRYSAPSSATKVLGGLIAKKVTQQLGRLPDKLADEDLDRAARSVLSRNRSQTGSVEMAKHEAKRLLAKARDVGSFRAAMEGYKRELRQLHEAEKIRRPAKRTLMIRSAVAATVVVVVLALVMLLW